MAVLYNEHSPKKLPEGESASATLEGNNAHRCVWQVLTDDANTPQDQILLATGLPRLGDIFTDPYSSYKNPTVALKKKEIIRVHTDKTHKMWHVQLEYGPPSTASPGQGPKGEPEPDPRKWHDEIEIDFNNRSVPLQKAFYEGGFLGGPCRGFKVGSMYPVVNSLGTRYHTPLEEEEANTVIRITKYRATWDSALEEYTNKINSDDFVIDKTFFYGYYRKFTKWQCKCLGVTGQFLFENNIPYWRATITLSVGDWLREVLDEGIYKRPLLEGEARPDGSIVESQHVTTRESFVDFDTVTDEFGMPITDPIPLDGGGLPLDEFWVKRGKFIYITWRTNFTRTFAELGL